MNFIKLKARNFLSIEYIEVELDHQGLILVKGVNDDAPLSGSNGAGKSAILDAICWCLWGNTVRGYKHDDVVNRFKKKNCMVSVSFSDEGVFYEVVRTRKDDSGAKPNDLHLFVDGDSDDAAGMAQTQARISSILGLEFETFQCMMPGAGRKAAELTDAKVKELLEQLLQTGILSKAQELVKTELKEYSGKQALIGMNLREQEEALTSLESLVSQYLEKQKEFESNKQAQIASLEAKILAQEKLIPDLTINKTIEDRQALKTTLKSKILLCDQEIKQVSMEAKQTETLDKQQLLKLGEDKATYQAAVKQLANQIQHFEKLNVCTSCLQEVDETHKNSQLSVLKIEWEGMKLELHKFVGAYEGLSSLMEGRSREAATKRSKQETAKSLLTAQLEEVVADLHKLELDQQRYSHVSADIQDLQTRVTALSQQASPYADLLVTAIDKAATAASEWARARKQYLLVEKQVDRLQFWVRGFSTKGIRNHVLQYITPILNQRAEYYSDMLTDGEMKVVFNTERKLKNNQTKDEFSIKVIQEHGGEDYTGNSKGERARADLVIAFALGDLASLRANKRIPFRFLDEPFENVDEVGHEPILKLLKLQVEEYDTIFCITHIRSFQDMFTKHLTAVKKDGITRIVNEH